MNRNNVINTNIIFAIGGGQNNLNNNKINNKYKTIDISRNK